MIDEKGLAEFSDPMVTTLRALGRTLHISNDVLIATWCIAEGVPLLADDRDFEPFARHLGLQLL